MASEIGFCLSVCDPTSWKHLTFAKNLAVLEEERVWMVGSVWGATLACHPSALQPEAPGC